MQYNMYAKRQVIFHSHFIDEGTWSTHINVKNLPQLSGGLQIVEDVTKV